MDNKNNIYYNISDVKFGLHFSVTSGSEFANLCTTASDTQEKVYHFSQGHKKVPPVLEALDNDAQ